jgi:cold shock CspA family protein
VSKTDETVQTGTVKWFNGVRGFIMADAGYRDVFCHSSQIVDEGHELSKGERVTFVEDVGRDGRLYARRIELVKEPESALTSIGET